MTIKELINLLQTVKDQDSYVFIEYDGPGGCDTCGYGCEVEAEITGIDDLDGKVWLKHE